MCQCCASEAAGGIAASSSPARGARASAPVATREAFRPSGRLCHGSRWGACASSADTCSSERAKGVGLPAARDASGARGDDDAPRQSGAGSAVMPTSDPCP